MDLQCPKCGEPWDNDCLHEVAADTASTYAKVAAQFRMIGCRALAPTFGEDFDYCRVDENAALRNAIYDLMGDDMDGAMSSFEDAEMIGLL